MCKKICTIKQSKKKNANKIAVTTLIIFFFCLNNLVSTYEYIFQRLENDDKYFSNKSKKIYFFLY